MVLSQGNLVSNLLDSAPLGGYSEDDVALGALPMDHVFGLALLTGAIVLRHRLYLTAVTAPEELLQVIAREKIARMNGVPSLYLSMAKKARPGEVCVCGPMRMLGYHGPEQTARAIDADGFLHTGDLGFVDENGILHLTGRKKDVIIRNGVNLPPRRIEEVLLAQPGGRAAAVVGLPDQDCGELPWAAVCAESALPRVMDGLNARLSRNELPAGILRLDAMPMTGSGKPDKQAVKGLIRQWRRV